MNLADGQRTALVPPPRPWCREGCKDGGSIGLVDFEGVEVLVEQNHQHGVPFLLRADRADGLPGSQFGSRHRPLIWSVRVVRHLSGPQARTKYQLLYSLLDLTTTLDPYFNIAYRFGAIFLSEAYPGGPGRPDQAIALLRKGIVAMPQKWQYYHDIGFVR